MGCSFKDLVHLNIVSTGTLPYFCTFWFPCCKFSSSWDNRTRVYLAFECGFIVILMFLVCFPVFTQFLNFRSLIFSELKCSSQPSSITLLLFFSCSIYLHILEQFLKFILFPLNRPPAVERTFSLLFFSIFDYHVRKSRTWRACCFFFQEVCQT